MDQNTKKKRQLILGCLSGDSGGLAGWGGQARFLLFEGCGRALYVFQRFGVDAIEAFSVVPLGDGRPDQRPEDQADGGEQQASVQAGVAGGIEVQDGPDPAEDLALGSKFATNR